MNTKLPINFINRLRKYFPKYASSILRGLSSSKRTTFRINRLKIDRRRFLFLAKECNIRIKDVTWYADAFVLLAPAQRDFQELEVYKHGQVYIQNLSSMIPVLLLDLKPGDKILDICAAPGSKTTQIASALNNECELVAVEKVKPRFYKLKANLERQGVSCCKLHLMDAIKVKSLYREYFDKVLVDVPCSAEGRFNFSYERSWRFWSERKVKEMQRKQKRIISVAYHSLRPGGYLVYSTCTFAPEENEFLIEWVLNKFPSLKIKQFDLNVKNVFPGLNGFGYHIIPTDLMIGFYVCVLAKE